MLKTSKIKFVILLLAGNAVLLQALAAEPVDHSLNELMLALAANGDTKSRFSETRTSRLTRRPVESSGVLEFIVPDVLIRHIIKPREVSFEVRANKVTIIRKGKSQTRSLHQLGAAQAFIESLRNTLGGNLVALQKDFLLVLSSKPSSWQLTLTSRDAGLAKKITRIQIDGIFKTEGKTLKHSAVVTAVEVIERNGSITSTVLEVLE